MIEVNYYEAIYIITNDQEIAYDIINSGKLEKFSDWRPEAYGGFGGSGIELCMYDEDEELKKELISLIEDLGFKWEIQEIIYN